MAKQKFTVQQMIEAIEGTGGIPAVVARKLGCSRETVGRYARRYPTVKSALIDADESITDLAEAKALALINSEYWPAIRYRLSTKGKDRGYTERHELTGAEGGPLVLRYTGNADPDKL